MSPAWGLTLLTKARSSGLRKCGTMRACVLMLEFPSLGLEATDLIGGQESRGVPVPLPRLSLDPQPCLAQTFGCPPLTPTSQPLSCFHFDKNLRSSC